MEAKVKTVGIIGGMGPAATMDLFYKIIKATPAKKDQDHIHVVIDNFPQIPDRTAFLLGRGESPLPYILRSVKLLEKAKVDVLCMPCNTAHYFVEDIRKTTPLSFISIIESTVNEVKRSFKESKNIGLLATDGTIIGKVYHRIFEAEGYKIITPSKEKQSEVTRITYSIKAGKMEENIQSLREIIEHMKFLGSDLIVLGCTELPIIIKYFRPSVQVIDATSCLAKEVVKFAAGT